MHPHIRRCAVALLATAMLSPEMSYGQTPPPVPPPSVPGQHAAALTLVSASGDSILLASDTLLDDPVRYVFTLKSAHDAFVTHLANGDTLRIDGATPGGTYVRDDGIAMTFETAAGYPRNYSVQRSATRGLYFSIRSTRQVAVLVVPEAQAPTSQERLDSLASALLVTPANSPEVRLDGAAVAFAYPADWYASAQVTFLPSVTAPYRCIWVAYGAAGSVRPARVVVGQEAVTWDGSSARRLPRHVAEILPQGVNAIGEVAVTPRSAHAAPTARSRPR